jgi:O-antigen ligase
VLLAIGFIADIRIPSMPGRGGEISARETVARALSAVDPKLAEEYGSQYTHMYGGTVGWRTKWWSAIWDTVAESPRSLIFGLGYGYPINSLVAELKQSDIRSPHNIFYFCLVYSGFIGVAIFFWLQTCIVALLWKTYRHTGEIFGLIFYVSTVIGAFFGNFLETPQEGISTYLMIGLAIAALFSRKVQAAKPVGIRVIQPTGPQLIRLAAVPGTAAGADRDHGRQKWNLGMSPPLLEG